MGQFENIDEFYKFMEQPANYVIDFQESCLLLKWKLTAH